MRQLWFFTILSKAIVGWHLSSGHDMPNYHIHMAAMQFNSLVSVKIGN